MAASQVIAASFYRTPGNKLLVLSLSHLTQSKSQRDNAQRIAERPVLGAFRLKGYRAELSLPALLVQLSNNRVDRPRRADAVAADGAAAGAVGWVGQ